MPKKLPKEIGDCQKSDGEKKFVVDSSGGCDEYDEWKHAAVTLLKVKGFSENHPGKCCMQFMYWEPSLTCIYFFSTILELRMLLCKYLDEQRQSNAISNARKNIKNFHRSTFPDNHNTLLKALETFAPKDVSYQMPLFL